MNLTRRLSTVAVTAATIISGSVGVSASQDVKYTFSNRPVYDKSTGECTFNGIQDRWTIRAEDLRAYFSDDYLGVKDKRFFCIKIGGDKDLSGLEMDVKDFRGSDFSGVDLRGSTFLRSYLSHVIMDSETQVDENTRFKEANVRGARISRVKRMPLTDIEESIAYSLSE